jgi:hypothetical protein
MERDAVPTRANECAISERLGVTIVIDRREDLIAALIYQFSDQAIVLLDRTRWCEFGRSTLQPSRIWLRLQCIVQSPRDSVDVANWH